MVMRKHQRYFPMYTDSDGKLAPTFVTIANGPVDRAVVAAGTQC